MNLDFLDEEMARLPADLSAAVAWMEAEEKALSLRAESDAASAASAELLQSFARAAELATSGKTYGRAAQLLRVALTELRRREP